MEIYNIETAKGIVKCYEQNGIYHVLNEKDLEKFNFELILNIEKIYEDE